MKVYCGEEKHPRIVLELRVDHALLTACVKDGSVNPAEVSERLGKEVESIVKAMKLGLSKAKAEAEEA